MTGLCQKQNIITLILIVATLMYITIGAVIFQHFEDSPHKQEVQKLREVYMNLTQKYNISETDMDQLLRVLHKNKWPLNKWALEPWEFPGAFYFTTVTVTTIGYGHSVPQTMGGMVFLIFYALLGIPLNLTMFQAIGERVGVLLSHALRRVKRILHLKNPDVPLTQLAIFALVIWVVFLMLGAMLFAEYEEWSWCRSFYYFFITVTTIGFGDMVALQDIHDPHSHAYHSQNLYVALTLIIIIVGLVISSTIINLLVMRLMELQQPRRKRKNPSWSSGPRCRHCKHMNNATDDTANVLENGSVAILQNFEEEIAFTSYKQVHDNNFC